MAIRRGGATGRQGRIVRDLAGAGDDPSLLVPKRIAGFFELDHADRRRLAVGGVRCRGSSKPAGPRPDRPAPTQPHLSTGGPHTLERMRLGMDRPVQSGRRITPDAGGHCRGRSDQRPVRSGPFYAKTARVCWTLRRLVAVLHALAHFRHRGLFRSVLSSIPVSWSREYWAEASGTDFPVRSFSPGGSIMIAATRWSIWHIYPHTRCRSGWLPCKTRSALWNCGKGPCPTHPLFDVDFYRSQVAGGDHLAHSVYHYLTSQTPPSPHPLFDPDFYAERARAVSRAGAQPHRFRSISSP